MGEDPWKAWPRQRKLQWYTATVSLRCSPAEHHKQSVSTEEPTQNLVAASTVWSMAPHRLHHSDVCLTRSFRGPTCWSDHCLIRSKLSIHIPVKHRHTRKSLKRLNTKALCGTDTQAMLQVELSKALCTATHPVADNVDDESTFVIETGSTRTISQPPSSWTTSITNTWLGLMIETRLIRKHHTSKHGKWSNVNCALWWAGVASELEAAADKHDMRSFIIISRKSLETQRKQVLRLSLAKMAPPCLQDSQSL